MSGSTSLETIETGLEAFRRELAESSHIALVVADAEARERQLDALTKRELTVHDFENAPLFVEWLGTEPVSVGIFEVGNPALDGFGLMKRLREGNPHAEIIAVSSTPDAAMAVACLEHGVQDLFAIPIERMDLFASRARAAIERFRRAAIDQRITDQFRDLAKSLLRTDDVRHRGAVDRFAKHLAEYKASLAHDKEILLVVANAYASGRTKSFLESEGYKVALASSRAEARGIAGSFEPRLVLADAELSDGTAFEAYADISRMHPDVEFLIVSSANAVDIALEAMSAGARDCILKPHEGLVAIQQKVKRALGLQTAHLKHQRLVDELRKLCAELVAIDAEAKQAGSVMIKVDPGKSQATLNRFLADLNREEQKRIRDAGKFSTRHTNRPQPR